MVASVLLLLCVVAPIVAGTIFFMAHGLELPRRDYVPLVVPIAPAPAPVLTAPAKRAPSREFAVEPTMVVNAELTKVAPSAGHRPAPPTPTVRPAPAAAPAAPAPAIAAAPPVSTPAPKRVTAPASRDSLVTPVQLPPTSDRRLAPPPPPRSRFARGSESPPIFSRAPAPPFDVDHPTNTFVSGPPTMFDDHTDVDEMSDAELPPWQSAKSRRFATAS